MTQHEKMNHTFGVTASEITTCAVGGMQLRMRFKTKEDLGGEEERDFKKAEFCHGCLPREQGREGKNSRILISQ